MRKEISLSISVIVDDNYQNLQLLSVDIGKKDYGDSNNGNGLTLDSVGKCVVDFLSQCDELKGYQKSIKP